MQNLTEINKQLAKYKLQPILFGISALMSLISIVLKMAFHISMWNTITLHKNQNIGWFFRKQRRISLLWNANTLFAIAITGLATAGIWGIYVNKKASEWLIWTKEITKFLEMNSDSEGITGAATIFSISTAGILLIVMFLNFIANITKGLCFVKKVLRRGVREAYELQQWNSIRTNLRIVETLQSLALISLLGFGAFMGLHIAGQKSILENVWAELTEKHQRWITIDLL